MEHSEPEIFEKELDHAEKKTGADEELTFAVRGLHCANCVTTLEKKLLENSAVKTAIVNLATETAFVRFNSKLIDNREILAIVHSAGYTPLELDDADQAKDDELRSQRNWMLFSIIVMLPVMFTMGWHANRAVMLINLLIATTVQFTAGIVFYRGAWNSIKNRTANMDLLVAIGTSAAYFYSLLAYFDFFGVHQPLFFETSVMLIAFIRLGKYLEVRARGKAGEALKKLLHLQVDKARLLTESGEEDLPASMIRVGDTVIVRPGELIPVDGVILEGLGIIDESMITGESMPVQKVAGENVTGATLNTSGVLKVQATRIGEATLLAQIICLVRDAQGDKAPIQRFADAVSSWFVPIVIIFSIITFIIWFLILGSDFITSFRFAVAVLVVACPCAMGLATPTAIMVGSGIALSHGILVKKGSALEVISSVKMVLLDKTGTLTEGLHSMTDLVPLQKSWSSNKLLGYLATAEAYSTHPLAKAVVKAAALAGVPLGQATDFKERGGFGISCSYNGYKLLVGNQRLMKEAGINLEALAGRARELSAEGKSLIYIAVGEELAGVAAFADTLKPSSAKAVATLRRLGIQTCMITGDNTDVAAIIAKQAAVDSFEAELLPERKQELVRDYQQRGIITAMIGDGINDAPALAAADIGIAIGSGTDVAKETGDIVLVKGDLMDAVRAILIGRATLLKIKQNLFWALFYNLLGIPIAAGVFSYWGVTLKPEYAGLAMALSSVSVVMNSIILKRIAEKL